jgi:hypothetical protein
LDAGLLINYGPALLENMTEADLAAIPDWIQKSFAKIRKHMNTEKQKLLKVTWDSGASVSISHDRADFVGLIDESPNERLSGLADGVAVAGRGHVAWSFLDTKGMLRTLKLPAYYVPASGMRLLSTTSLLQHYPNEFLMGDQRGLQLSGTFGTPEAGTKPTNGVEATYDPQTNLPVAYTFDYDGSRRPSGLISSFNGSSSADRDASNASGASSGVSNGVPSPTIMVIRVDTDLLGIAGAPNSRVCRTARATLTYGSAGLWDPTDSMVHQALQSPNSNRVMTLLNRPTNRLFGKIWRIRRLLRASQPLQQQAPQTLQIQVHLLHGRFWLRIPTLRTPKRSCCAGIIVSDTSRSGASSS